MSRRLLLSLAACLLLANGVGIFRLLYNPDGGAFDSLRSNAVDGLSVQQVTAKLGWPPESVEDLGAPEGSDVHFLAVWRRGRSRIMVCFDADRRAVLLFHHGQEETSWPDRLRGRLGW